jgi:hypothetical protein
MDVMDQIVGATLDTTATGGGNQLNHGKYVVFLDKVIAKAGNEGPVFIPEFYVSQAEDVSVNGAMQKATAPGTTAGYPCKMNQKEAASNARAFVLAVLGLPETGKDDPNLKAQINNAMRRMVQPDQPLRGMAFQVTTWVYVNKGRRNAANAGKTFPRYNFTKLPNQNMTTLAANKAVMDNAARAQTTAQAQTVLNPAAPVAPAPVQAQAQAPAQYPGQPAPVQYAPPPAQAPAPVYGGAAAPVPVHQYPPQAQAPAGYPAPGYAPAPVQGYPPPPPPAPAPAAPVQYAQALAPAAPPQADPFAGMFN